ncbi:hypothetical protein QR680_016012 [Steinernema hermaphroditum]|uniref:CHK kinase-like domain-containing protein n=1 Tax=Steinernema hermaphroditum TaxID=289476 RepID=A0AA39LLV2_9BILA|nr:hypothetical protein QR680_016012 [Steinernema hermaphroditum]
MGNTNAEYNAVTNFDTSKNVADSPITIDWLLRNLHLSDPFFTKLNKYAAVSDVTAEDISDGKGFISKVYKVDICLNNSKEPYEVILKVPGVESFNAAYQNDHVQENGTIMNDKIVAVLHNTECDFYSSFAPHLDIPLVKIYKIQKRTIDEHPGALLMESMVAKGGSYSLSTGANIHQIFEVIKHICSFQAYMLSLPAEKWIGKYNFDVFGSFSKDDMFGPFFEKLKILKPGMFDEGIKEFDKYRMKTKFMKYIMIEIYKDLDLPAVLCHGDFWNNNVLWKIDSNGLLTNEIAAIIDWQALHEGCLTDDLSRFMCVCTDGDLRREYENEILQYYYDTITNDLKKDVTFKVEQVRKAYEANFIQQAMICMFAGPFLFNCDSLTGDEKQIGLFTYWSLGTSSSHHVLSLSCPISVNATFANYRLNYKLAGEFDAVRCEGKKLFIFVITTVSSYDQRDVIRQTWASNKHTRHAVVTFIVGQPKTRIHEELLIHESDTYGDIVVTSIPDSYNFTAFKVHAGYYLHNTYCPHVPFVLRADDDIVALPDRFVHFINSGFFGNDEKAIYGILVKNSKPVRDPNHKWYIPMDYYNQSAFPTYVNGPAYLMTAKSTEAILEKTPETTFFWIEDVLFTGLMAEKTGVKLVESLGIFKFYCNERDKSDRSAFDNWDHEGYCMRQASSCDKSGVPHVTLISHAPDFPRPNVERAYNDMMMVHCHKSLNIYNIKN